jgi:paired amphipathic helix protein Sin3a
MKGIKRKASSIANTSAKRLKQSQAPKQAAIPDMSTTQPSLIPPALPVPLPPQVALNASTDDFSFFDRIRKQIGNKALWAEFLKLLNLYKHDFIDVAFLVFKSQAFIGSNPDLMQQFKDYLKFKDADVRVVNEPQTVSGRIQLSNCRGLGPSYRLLPKQETNKKCSGRDELCNSVLNDSWVSHPTWASEDSGFVAHRKNQHEEGLHRVEEERHDYDFYIECCRRSIQLLEPIAQGLAGLSPENRVAFQLDPKLGGQSEAIYRRVIFKIYGREKGNEVVRELFRRPYDVIPTLLARMKTQCEQWKAAQIQWEKVWRAQTESLFWRSLDHQGAATRVADKRQFFAKQLINEVQVRYQEQKRQRELNRVASLDNWHFEYSCEDKQILRDSAGLVLLFAEQNFSTEHPTLTKNIKELLTTFFLLESNDLDQESFAADHDVEMEGSDIAVSPRQRPAKGPKGGLLRGVLDKRRARDAEDSESRSRQSTPDEPLAEMTDAEPSTSKQSGNDQPSTEKWFEHPTGDNILDGRNLQPNEPYKRSTYNMYSNAAIYCFMRLFGILVERLEKVKSNEENVKRDVQFQKERTAAHELGWIAKEPAQFFGDISPTANYYAQMLDLFKNLVRNDVDNQTVEDTLRRYYLQDGWQLYSLDKLLSALNKFAMGIFFPDAKEKTPDIYALFKKDRARGDVITHKEEVHYRRSVDRLAREGEIYRIGWVGFILGSSHGEDQANTHNRTRSPQSSPFNSSNPRTQPSKPRSSPAPKRGKSTSPPTKPSIPLTASTTPQSASPTSCAGSRRAQAPPTPPPHPQKARPSPISSKASQTRSACSSVCRRRRTAWRSSLAARISWRILGVRGRLGRLRGNRRQSAGVGWSRRGGGLTVSG